MRLFLVTILISLILSSSLYSLKRYRVRSGDTLWSISRRYRVSVAKLRTTNHLYRKKLFVGMRLTIPGKRTRVRSRGRSIPSRSSGTRWYRVKRGDTIWGICRKFRISRTRFMQINRLRSSSLVLGKRVRVSLAARRSPAVSSTRSRKKQYSGWRWYRVKRGDSLWRIARRVRVSIRTLRRLNGRSARKIYVGQRLKVPAAVRIARTRTARRRISRYRRRRIRGNYFGRLPRSYAKGFNWPVRGKIVEKVGIARKGINNGITIRTLRGVRVKASQRGTVTYCGRLRGYGNVVIVRHSAHVYTVYAHLSSIFVKPGARVARGRILANTGWVKRTRCHGLHFQMYYKTRPVNPLVYLG